MSTAIETAQEFIERKSQEFRRSGKVIEQSRGDAFEIVLTVEAFTFMPDMYSGGRKVFLLERCSGDHGACVSCQLLHDERSGCVDMDAWVSYVYQAGE
jgi:hypothetical protein